MVAVPVGLIAERRVITRLMRANAVTAEAAQPLDGLPWAQARRLRRLVDADVVREAQPGRFYLHAPALADRLTSRRRRAAVLLAAVIALMGASLYLAR